MPHSNSGPANAPVTSNFLPGPNTPILNYPGPQFPQGVAGTPAVTTGLPLTAIPALPGTVTVGGAGIPLMAAAADPIMIAPDTFTDVRGGVTYFNPTAQNFLPQRQVSKRAKAPIAIVDPSQMQRGNSLPKDGQDIIFNGVKREDSLPIESNIASSESNSKELT